LANGQSKVTEEFAVVALLHAEFSEATNDSFSPKHTNNIIALS
jgi:hypothetical protein